MHDLLEPNPYWLLGLPGNATRREIVTTASRLRLRLVAGRELLVEDPLNDKLGIPIVTVAQFDALVRQLDDPRLRLQHRLLRFTRATKDDETAWREMLSRGKGLAVLAVWPRQGNLATRLNRARWMWWDCHGYVTDVEKPWWRECLILWSRIVDDPGFFSALAPEAVEATFEQPATEADFQAAVEVVPALLEQMFEYISHDFPLIEDVVTMTDAVRYAMLPESWTQQLFEKLWAPRFSYAESTVEEFEASDAESVNDCRMEYIDRMHDLEKLGAEGTPLAKRIRRRMGKSLHAKALFFEKNGPLMEAVSCIRFSRYLLDGTPDVVPVRPDEVRIVELARKAAMPPPPPPLPVSHALPVETVPLPIAALSGAWFPARPPALSGKEHLPFFEKVTWVMGFISFLLFLSSPLLCMVMLVGATVVYGLHLTELFRPQWWSGVIANTPQEISHAIVSTSIAAILMVAVAIGNSGEPGNASRGNQMAHPTSNRLMPPSPSAAYEEPEEEVVENEDDIWTTEEELESRNMRAERLDDEEGEDPWNE